MGRRTKIVATIGPASWSAPVLRKMIEAGVDVAPINLSHGSLDGAPELYRTTPAAARARHSSSCAGVSPSGWFPAERARTLSFWVSTTKDSSSMCIPATTSLSATAASP